MNNHWEVHKSIFTFDKENICPLTFEERLGEPDQLSTCIGLIVMQFFRIERKLSKGIQTLMTASPISAMVLNESLQYSAKVKLFFEMVEKLIQKDYISPSQGIFPENDYLILFQNALIQCNELYQELREYDFNNFTQTWSRVIEENTIKWEEQQVLNRKCDTRYFVDVHDFMGSIALEVDDFMCDIEDRIKLT